MASFGFELSGFAAFDLTDLNRGVVVDLERNTSPISRGGDEELFGLELDADLSIFAVAVDPSEVLDLGVVDVGVGSRGFKIFVKNLPISAGHFEASLPIPVGAAVSIFGRGGGVSVQRGGGGTRIPLPFGNQP